jgi:hypothetical protein
MKLNFKKISAVLGSVIMAGATLGFAAAASFPAPFVQNGVANNVAVVYGANAASTDNTQAGLVSTALGTYVSGGSATVSGENVALDRPSSLLHLGNGVADVFGRSVTKTDMPTLLADGTYRDGSNNDHDYTQKIDVANMTLQQFDLSSYDTNVSSNTPTIGFPINSGDSILNYTLTFQDPVNASEMQYSNLEFMGTEYYVLSASTTSLTLLDSSASASLSDGASTTLNVGNTSYAVSATIYSGNKVIFTINGQTTDALQQGDTYKLNDGSYVGVKEVLGATYAGGSSTVQFSIGSGKIVMSSGSNVVVNSNSVDGVTSKINYNGDDISSIQLLWAAGNSAAITKDMSLTMPTFGGAKLSFSGMSYPSNETTTVSNDGNTGVKLSTTVQNGPVSFDILGLDKTSGNFTTVGKDSSNLLETASGTSLDFNANGVNASAIFVVSWNDSKDAESYVYKVNNFVNSSGTIKANLVSQDGGSTITMTDGTAVNIGVGNIVLTPTINYTAKTVSFSGNAGVDFHTLYTKDGLKIVLPLGSDLAGNGTSSFAIPFTEEAKDGTIGGGSAFTVTVGHTGTSGSYQTSVTNIGSAGNGIEDGNSNVYMYNIPSALATTIAYDQGPTQETATITYHGGESSGTLYLTTPGATVSSGGSLGNVLFTDAEKSSWQNDNVVIVGGSCINSAAATVLGGAYCGADFTSATGVGAGQFMIKGVQDAFSSGKLALVVAGYNADDTVNAVTYLTHQTVDTSGSYIGTSATEATLQTTA